MKCAKRPAWPLIFDFFLFIKASVPHAFGRAILQVLQQLRETQHGFEHDGQGAQRLHEQGRIQQQESEDGALHGEAEAEEQVVLEGAPLPEGAQVQVCGSGETQRRGKFRAAFELLINTCPQHSSHCWSPNLNQHDSYGTGNRLGLEGDLKGRKRKDGGIKRKWIRCGWGFRDCGSVKKKRWWRQQRSDGDRGIVNVWRGKETGRRSRNKSVSLQDA